MDRYLIHEKIGSGNYAKVYLATDLYTKQEVSYQDTWLASLSIPALYIVRTCFDDYCA